MNNLGRADVERIIEGVLQELKIDVETSNINRKIVLSYRGKEISQAWFTISEDDYYGL